MAGKFRYRVDYKIISPGSIEVQADNDIEAGEIVEEAAFDGELQTEEPGEIEVTDTTCLDSGTCSKCGAEAPADLLAHTGGLCRTCVG